MNVKGQYSVFQWLRWRAFRNASALLVGHSRIRLATIVFCCLLIAGTVFAASAEGFGLLQTYRIPFSGRIVGTLFDFLFLSLAVLLVFSGGLILYGSLFSAAETTFLLSTPARADQVFAYKFQTAIGFSSWAFLLLGIPILLSYGLMFAVPWYYYPLLPVFLIGFLLVPGSIGAIACFLVVNITPQRRKQVLAIGIAAVVLCVLWWTYQTFQEIRNPRSNRDALVWLDSRFAFSRAALMPSHWMTRGLQSAARGDLAGAAYPLALLWANGLMFYLVAAWTAGRLYRRGFNRLATGGAIRKRVWWHSPGSIRRRCSGRSIRKPGCSSSKTCALFAAIRPNGADPHLRGPHVALFRELTAVLPNGSRPVVSARHQLH